MRYIRNCTTIKRPLSRRLSVRFTSVTWNVLYALKTQTTAPNRRHSQLSAPNKHVPQVDLQLRSTGQREEHGSTARLTPLDLHSRCNGVSYHLDSTKNARNCLVAAGNKPKTIRHFEWPGKTRMQKDRSTANKRLYSTRTWRDVLASADMARGKSSPTLPCHDSLEITLSDAGGDTELLKVYIRQLNSSGLSLILSTTINIDFCGCSARYN